jgi:type IV pilus assembly protein PilY1
MIRSSFSSSIWQSVVQQSIFAVAGVLSTGVVMAQVNLAQSPLFVTKGVTPSIMIALDDSGSMDSEVLMKSNDGAVWWNTTAGIRSFAGRGRNNLPEAGVVNFNEAGNADTTWRKFVYLFPNGSGGNTTGRRTFSDSTNDHFAVPPLPQFAFARSPIYNFAYFDPRVQYVPWPSLGGYTFGNSNPVLARTDPVFPTTGMAPTFDLTANVENTSDNNVFRMFAGMTIPTGIRNAPRGGSTWTDTGYSATDANDLINFRAISYFPAQFFLSSDVVLGTCYGYISSNISTTGRAPDGVTPLNGYEIRPANFQSACGRTAAENYTTAIQNFANWFTYYRKRHAAGRNALGVAFETITDFRVGLYRINDRPSASSLLTMRNLLVPADRTAFFAQAYTSIGSGGTPNREAVHAMQSQLQRTDSGAPIQLACQKNFGVLITDGFANNTTISGVGNRDVNMGPPFADSYSSTLADIAAGLYLDNPRPLLPTGRVPIPPVCSAAGASLRLDCNPNLHLNLFAISLGAPGNIFNVDVAATANPFANPPTWPNPTEIRNPQQIDDLWHATLNSRGEFLSVDVPSELGDSFKKILESIRARVETSGGSAAASSAVLQTDSLLYNAQFRSEDWSGELVARKLDKNGEPADLAWSAESLLATVPPANRKIFTSQSNGTGVSLALSNLDAAQTAALSVNPVGAPGTSATAEDRVNWIRGQDVTSLRSRLTGTNLRRLGDVIGSDPQFMAKTDFGFQLITGSQGATYQSFRASSVYKARPNTLFVGSNGGMFHTFNAATGAELFAYMPSEFLEPRAGGAGTHAQINDLMRPDYQHRFFVDGTAAVSDAFVGGAWKTVAVGTLGAGGRTVFALDVTNPEAFDASKVLWEFKYAANACTADPTGVAGSTACRDIGEGVTKPKVARLVNGTWVAVFGNGFNSPDHQARLLVVDLNTGRLLYNLLASDVPSTASASNPNGLSPAETTDWPLNQLSLTNAYAGDLQGNLWRFNFAPTTPTVTKIFVATDPTTSTTRQPITARPSLALRPGLTSELVVVFGTGSFFRQGDDSSTTAARVQTMYGVFDRAVAPTSPTTRSDLQSQTIASNTSAVTLGTEVYPIGALRFVSQNTLSTTQKGWRIDLPVTGERVISEATFPSGALRNRVRLTTLVPDPDPCVGGRRGFVMDVSLAGGARFDGPVFDLSGDRAFNSSDLVGGNNVSGINKSRGERLTIIRDSKISGEGGYGGDGSKLFFGLNTSGVSGRQSWQQLR